MPTPDTDGPTGTYMQLDPDMARAYASLGASIPSEMIEPQLPEGAVTIPFQQLFGPGPRGQTQTMDIQGDVFGALEKVFGTEMAKKYEAKVREVILDSIRITQDPESQHAGATGIAGELIIP